MAENEYEKELTPEAVLTYRNYAKYRKGKRNSYSALIKETMQDMLSTEISIDGANMTVAEKIVMGTLNEVIEKPSVDKVIGLAKITGEYSEKVEAKVSDLNTIMEKLSGSEF